RRLMKGSRAPLPIACSSLSRHRADCANVDCGDGFEARMCLRKEIVMTSRKQLRLLVVAALAAVAASGVAATAQAKKAAAPKAKKPRVFFIEPKNGATVSSP